LSLPSQGNGGKLGGDHLGGAGEEGWGKGLKVLGGRGGYGRGFVDGWRLRLMIKTSKSTREIIS